MPPLPPTFRSDHNPLQFTGIAAPVLLTMDRKYPPSKEWMRFLSEDMKAATKAIEPWLAGNERLKAAGWEAHGDGSGYWRKGIVSHVHRDEALKEVAWQAGEASLAAQEAAVAPLASPAGEGSGIQFVTRKDPGAPDGMVTHEARLPRGRGEYVRHCVRLPNDASETTVAAWHRVLAGHVMRKAHPPSSNSVRSDDLLVTFRPILGVVQPTAL